MIERMMPKKLKKQRDHWLIPEHTMFATARLMALIKIYLQSELNIEQLELPISPGLDIKIQLKMKGADHSNRSPLDLYIT